MRNKGITLVALVITIIIMLILAGVTLNLALGDNGLFKMASQTAEKYKTAQREEESAMQGIADELQGLIGKGEDDKTPGVIDGEGTEDKPFLIESIEDLVAFSNKVNGGTTYENQIVKLTVNLDFKAEDSYADYKTTTYGDINGANGAEELKTELTTGEGFKSIGNDKQQFKGTFDGQNRTISNLYINVAEDYKGLFGYVGSKGTIKNLTISNANINCEAEYIGTLVGYVDGGTIENIKINNGTVKGNKSVGGIIGYCDNKSTVNNCSNSSNVTSKGILGVNDNRFFANTGGITGCCKNGTIINAQNTGNINAVKGIQIGGVVGVVTGTSIIDSCFNNGKVGEVEYEVSGIGGIAGSAYGDNMIITKCHNAGIISGSIHVGGIVGEFGWNSTSYLEACYNTGVVTAIGGEVGGIGFVSIGTKSSKIKNCYNTGNVSTVKLVNNSIRKHCRNR